MPKQINEINQTKTEWVKPEMTALDNSHIQTGTGTMNPETLPMMGFIPS